MKKLYYIWMFVLAVTFIGCSDSSPTNSEGELEEASAEKQFVWDAMNYWYYWQGDVPELGDNYFDNDEEYNRFLKEFSSAEELFYSLLYSEDDFSFFIEDYEEYQDEQDGIYAALGFNYGFFYKSETELAGYVRYVVPDSPAEEAGLERLDLFTKVDGTVITENNYINLLTDDSSHELTMAHLDTTGGNLSYVEDSTVTVASEQVTENPIFESKVIDANGTKVGYLVYNAFQRNRHGELNDVFGDFKSQGVDELVIDLRYNGGGTLVTSQLLSSLVSDLGSSDKFSELEYNDKRSSNNRELFFLDEVPLENEEGELEQDDEGNYTNTESKNNLSLPSVYVLTTRSTASASEVLVNSLDPYIDVTLIGVRTLGKDEGSFTLYDTSAPYLESDDANPDHKKAIQPIVSKIVNSNGEDYPNGFSPEGYTEDTCTENCVQEITVENIMNKPNLGDLDEPLLAHAIDLITGQSKKKSSRTFTNSTRLPEIKTVTITKSLAPQIEGIHLEPSMMPAKVSQK